VTAGDTIQSRCRNRWPSILEAIGVPAKVLNGKHHPCPFPGCGGTDRFRFDDKEGTGSYYCSQCGSAHGVGFVMKFLGTDFIGAKAAIEARIGEAKVIAPKVAADPERMTDYLRALWGRSSALTGSDAASLYLERRGVDARPWPSQLRYVASLPYKDQGAGKVVGYFPALLAKMVSPDGSKFQVHRTYLDEDGRKADVPEAKKMCPGPIARGSAVRLAPSAEVMGISTGIETALAASILFELPVWAATTDAMMQGWKPPAKAREIWIFGDNDASWSGHCASYGLAYKLTRDGYKVETRISPSMGEDWNDVLMQRMGIVPDFKAREAKEQANGDASGQILEHQGDWL
jgi:putative DNA primase/helicase